MSDTTHIRERIRAKIERGEFLARLIITSDTDTAEVQSDFINKLTEMASGIRDILMRAGLIRRIEYDPTSFWPKQRGSGFCFIDGGVASIDLPSAAPIGLRVGSYVVRPGDQTSDRERFNIELSLVDELYGPDAAIFIEATDDIEKLRDAARIMSESAAAWHIAKRSNDVDAIFIHGPIVNPVSPYGFQDFPPFTNEAYAEFIGQPVKAMPEDDRHFVVAYRHVLERLIERKIPVYGVVERSWRPVPVVIHEVLNLLQSKDELSPKDGQKIRNKLADYNLNDVTVFDIALRPGEYIVPVSVNRQGPENKWPNNWKSHIRAYPNALTTFLKPSDDSETFRIETLEGFDSPEKQYGVILHTARLLPRYGFPVGLDIVDKFAKVPSWMSRSIRGQHATVLLKHALKSNDPKILAWAKRALAARGRDWLFRPGA